MFEGLKKSIDGNKRAQIESDEMVHAHDSGLYDQDEDRAGEQYDLATGKSINNSIELDKTNITEHTDAGYIISKGNRRNQDALPPIIEKTAEELVAEYEASLKKNKS